MLPFNKFPNLRKCLLLAFKHFHAGWRSLQVDHPVKQVNHQGDKKDIEKSSSDDPLAHIRNARSG